MFTSIIHQRGPVPFPVFAGERHYMIPFYQRYGLPGDLGHWQPTVDAMLDGIETDQPIYFMADQSVVHPGQAHRRPGVHIDGYWHPGVQAHGGGGGHRGRATHYGRPSHRGSGRHGGQHMRGGWDHVDLSEPEALILSSDVAGARAYLGKYPDLIGDGGEASRVPLDGLLAVDLAPHRAYVGTVGTLHESLPIPAGGPRTVVRLNCPGVTVQ